MGTALQAEYEGRRPKGRTPLQAEYEQARLARELFHDEGPRVTTDPTESLAHEVGRRALTVVGGGLAKLPQAVATMPLQGAAVVAGLSRPGPEGPWATVKERWADVEEAGQAPNALVDRIFGEPNETDAKAQMAVQLATMLPSVLRGGGALVGGVRRRLGAANTRNLADLSAINQAQRLGGVAERTQAGQAASTREAGVTWRQANRPTSILGEPTTDLPPYAPRVLGGTFDRTRSPYTTGPWPSEQLAGKDAMRKREGLRTPPPPQGEAVPAPPIHEPPALPPGPPEALAPFEERLRALDPVMDPRNRPLPDVALASQVPTITRVGTTTGKARYAGGDKRFRTLSNEELLDKLDGVEDRLQRAINFNQDATRLGVKRSGRNQANGFAALRSSADRPYLYDIEKELNGRGITDLEGVRAERDMRLAMAADENLDPAVQAPLAEQRRNPWTPGNERGTSKLPVFTGLAGAGVGATIGATEDKEHPVRGGIVGALVGGALGGMAGVGAERIGASAAAKDIRRFLSPAGRTPESAATAGIVRAQTGQMARSNEVVTEALKGHRKQLGALPIPEQMRFIDAIETGQRQAHPAHQPAADALRGALDDARRSVQALGTGKLDHFIENYFPHIWKDPDQAQNVIGKILGKRPLEGPKSFLKQRTIPTTAEGLSYGLEPVTTNPVDLTLLKIREMHKYVMGQKIMADLRGRGLTVPDRQPGYVRIHDYVAQNEWAPEPVATIVNRYLSPGLRGHALYDAYQGLGNTLNQAQLGLSAFHLGFTSLDALQSKLALGALQLGRGEPLRAAKSLLAAPAAPLTTYLKGSTLLREYLHPGTQGAELAKMANAVAEAGGRVRMDAFYKNNHVDQFFQAMHEHRYPSAALRAIPAVFEATAKPVMEHIVPRQKLGVYLDLARHELAHLPPGASVDEVRVVLGRAWDSVDNRMGQLVYDNLFWDKTFKDLAMASVRSVGWNTGTIRELGGGAVDLARGRWTPRASYAVSLPIGAGMVGGIIHYLYTGKAPETLKDYFFPRTGRKDPEGNEERVQLPTYMKDVFAYSKHPIQTIGHKVHPMLGMVSQMLQNQDFYGDMLRNPDDPLVTQLRQSAEYLGTEVLPFGIRNMQESARRGQPLSVQLPSLVGVTPAKREDVRTPAQNQMQTYLRRRGQAENTPEERVAADRRHRLAVGVRDQTISHAALKDSVRAGAMTPQQAIDMVHRGAELPSVAKFKNLTLPEAERVYQMAGPEEQGQYWDWLRLKRANERQANPYGASR